MYIVTWIFLNWAACRFSITPQRSADTAGVDKFNTALLIKHNRLQPQVQAFSVLINGDVRFSVPRYCMKFPQGDPICPSFQTASGNVEAKVVCFYRRRDISQSLIQLADKHASEWTWVFSRAMWMYRQGNQGWSVTWHAWVVISMIMRSHLKLLLYMCMRLCSGVCVSQQGSCNHWSTRTRCP